MINQSIRLLITALLLIANSVYSIDINPPQNRIHPDISSYESVHSIEFYNNKFRTPCRDTALIRNRNHSIRIKPIYNDSCIIYIDSELMFDSTGMVPSIKGNELTLRSTDGSDSLFLNLDDVFTVRQNDQSIKGEPNLASKAFPIIGGILIPTAILAILIVVLWANSGGPSIN